ncbi:MAG: hypothetical protein IKU55_02090 [Clostridia bacterium]|nr:hypothetical protein [Clostridia bacterium]
MKRMLALLLATVMVLAMLAACGSADDPAVSDTQTTSVTSTSLPQTTALVTTADTDVVTGTAQTTAPAQTTSPIAKNEATLYIPFDLEQPDTFALPYTGELDASILLSGLALLTGWNCDVAKVDIFSDTARIDFALTALPFSYDQLTRNDTFFLTTYADTVFLFLDSIAKTLTENLKLNGVIFTQNGGNVLDLPRLYTSVELFPADTLYRGSAYYRALLLDDPYSNSGGYPMLQAAGGMTVLYPNGFTVESETDTEIVVSAEDRVFITYRAYELVDEMAVASAIKSNDWAERMTTVAEKEILETGYLVTGTMGPYCMHVYGYMAPIKGQYFEVSFMYEEGVDFVDMTRVIEELSFALTKYN